MNRRFLAALSLASLAALPLAARAQSDIVLPAGGGYAGLTGAISVTGHGELHVRPDVAYVTLSAETDDRSESVAVRTNAAKMQAVLTALAGSNVLAKDIHTNNFTVNTNYDYDTHPATFTGYSVTNSVSVTIRDLSKVGVILDKTTKAGATSDGLSFDLSDKGRVQGEALVAAATNARSKADLLAGATGVEVGRLLSISEQGAQPPAPQPAMFAMRAAVAGAAAPEPPTQVSAQDITITSDVTASFAIATPNH